MTSPDPVDPAQTGQDDAAAGDVPRTGLAAPIWIGILTAAILVLVAFIARNSIAA